jgi:hypothetical protein
MHPCQLEHVTRITSMKVSEKSLELNSGAELLNLLRNSWDLNKAYPRCSLILRPRSLPFRFKATRGKDEFAP